MPRNGLLWTDEQSATLLRLIDSGVRCADAAIRLNAQFGTARTRRACASHLYDKGRRSARVPGGDWDQEHDDLLVRRLGEGASHSQVAAALNAQFGTKYTRNACIGRAHRLAAPKPPRPRPAGTEALNRKRTDERRAKRWADNPSLKERYDRLQELKQARLARGPIVIPTRVSKPSRQFRVSVPRPVAMTKGEMRAMLTQIVRNTAAMEISP